MIVLKTAALESLCDFLSRHEPDIAHEIEDFGDLRNVFHLIFERWPKDGTDE